MSIKFLMKKAGLSPITAAILAGGVGTGAGYLWNKYDENNGTEVENKWGRPVSLGLLAAAPFLAHGFLRGNLDKYNGEHTTGAVNRWFSDDETYEKNPVVAYNLARDLKESRDAYAEQLDSHGNPKWKNIKYSDFIDMKPDAIPVNAFNQATWLDASVGRTPTETAGFFTNTMNATRNRVGSSFVSPGQVMKTLTNAGIGFGTSWLAGKALGALTGISPASQRTIQEMGTWGGMLGGLHNQIRADAQGF